MTNVAEAEFAGDLQLRIAAEVLHDLPSYFHHAGGMAGANIDTVRAFQVAQNCAAGGFSNIFNINEIPAFHSVLKNADRPVEPRKIGEDGENACIGIGKRLSGSEDILVAQGDGRDVKGSANEEHHLLLYLFGETVKGGRRERGGLGGGCGRDKGVAEGAGGVILASLHALREPGARVDQAMLRAGVCAFPVDGAGRGGNKALDLGRMAVGEQVEQQGGAGQVGVVVALHFVHRLAGTRFGG